MLNIILKKEKAPESTEAEFETNSASIVAYLSNLIKLKRDQVSRKFWVANYSLEENRQDHAARGHLWRQISYCLTLLLFRVIGKVMP